MKMKSLTLFIALTFSVMLSSSSYAGWTEVSESEDGDVFYIDFERIRKVDGYVYFWELGDYLKPDKFGDLSAKVYKQGDCKLFRFKTLSGSFHKEPMGGGTGDVQEPIKKSWKYPIPNSSGETILKSVCNR
jgi:hypothetical protein